MLSTNLFKHVLTRPVFEDRADELRVISGFATAALADRHLESLDDAPSDKVRVELVVGMAPMGLSAVQHYGFQRVMRQRDNFRCRYLVGVPPCHAKLYLWLRNGLPVVAFVGSANYTLTGFESEQMEVLAHTDPLPVVDYWEQVVRHSLPCIHPEIAQHAQFIHNKPVQLKDGDRVSLSFVVKRSGDTHSRAGLNWGQRPGRHRDQAYIPVHVAARDFFPPRGRRFTVLADDLESFTMVRAQDHGKALHTTYDNSELGAYFRARLGVSAGEFVERWHLDRYGRTDVDFYRIDSETYFMDFSVAPSG